MKIEGYEAVRRACTVLFVPGHRPDRFVKALSARADAVIIDLEDAVAPRQKEQALQHVVQLLTSTTVLASPVLVRLNALDSPWSNTEQERLAALVAARPARLAGVVVPKAGDGGDLKSLSGRLTSSGAEPVAVVALIESARGVLRAGEIADCPGLTRLALGAVDLALDLNAHADADVLTAARSALVLASAAAGLPAPLDSPSTAVHDLAQVHREAQRAVREGFGGKLCIHPAQLPAVREAFTPTAGEVEHARRVIAASTGAGNDSTPSSMADDVDVPTGTTAGTNAGTNAGTDVGDRAEGARAEGARADDDHAGAVADSGAVTMLDGHMIDRPVLLHALNVLRRFKETKP
jgi:citrate lyase subunit beta/citryl-CoA lyase